MAAVDSSDGPWDRGACAGVSVREACLMALLPLRQASHAPCDI